MSQYKPTDLITEQEHEELENSYIGQSYIIDREMINKIYELGSYGLLKSLIIEALPISQSMFYDCQKIHRIYKNKSYDEKMELSTREKLQYEFMEAFEQGRRKCLEDNLKILQQTTDIRVRLQMIQRIFPDFQMKKKIDLEELDLQLRKEFGSQKTEAVIELLLSNDEEQEDEKK